MPGSHTSSAPNAAEDDLSETYEGRTARIAEWRARLLGAVRLEQRLQLLAEIGLSDLEISRTLPNGTGSARSVRRWRSEGVARGRVAGRWEPIDDVCSIVGFLLSDGTYDEAGVVAWLRSRRPELGQKRPLDELGAGNFNAVLAAAEGRLGSAPVQSPATLGPIGKATERTTTADHSGSCRPSPRPRATGPRQSSQAA